MNTHINKIRDEKGDTVTDTTKIQKIIGECFWNLLSNKLVNPEEMYTFLGTGIILKLN